MNPYLPSVISNSAVKETEFRVLEENLFKKDYGCNENTKKATAYKIFLIQNCAESVQ